MSETINNVIKASIIVAVIVLVVIFFVPLFSNQIIPWFNETFNVQLSDVQQKGSNENFNLLMDNIEKCYFSEDTNCFCEVFPNYPGTFPTNTKLNFKIEGTDTTIGLYAGKTKLFEEKTNAVIFTNLVIIKDGKQEFDFQTALNNYESNDKNLEYSKEPPFLSTSLIKEGPKLISGLIYKEGNERLYLLTTKDNNIKSLEMKDIPYCNLEHKQQLIS